MLHQAKVGIKLVLTTLVTYLKAHLLQKLLFTPLVREIVTENTANTEGKTFSRTILSI